MPMMCRQVLKGLASQASAPRGVVHAKFTHRGKARASRNANAAHRNRRLDRPQHRH